jgi:outer membrane protein insertion porin family
MRRASGTFTRCARTGPVTQLALLPDAIASRPRAVRRGSASLLWILLVCAVPLGSVAQEAPQQGGERRPVLRKVHLEGNEVIGDDEIIGILPLQRGQVVTPEVAQKAAEAVFALYAAKGYAKARVLWRGRDSSGERERKDKGPLALAQTALRWLTSPSGRKDPPSLVGMETADLYFLIDEGKQVTVEELRLVGNAHFDDEALQKLLRTKRRVPLADLLGWGLFQESSLMADVMALEAYYLDAGFLDAKVGPPRTELSADQKRARIQLPVVEGERYRIGRVTVIGDLVVDEVKETTDEEVLFSRRVLLGRLGVKPGEAAGRAAIAAGLQRVVKKYRDHGYAYANVTPELNKRPGTQIVDVEVQIEAGPRVRVERVEILGNDKTRDNVIRREMRLYEGEWFSADRLKRSEARVRALGFFKTVNVSTGEGTDPRRMTVTVEVEEKNTGIFQLGAGFGAEGFLFNSQIAYANFLGLGQRAAFAAQLSGARRLFDLSMGDPFFLELGEHPVALGFRAYQAELTFGEFRRSASGLDFTLAYPLGRPLSFLTNPWTEDAPEWARPFVPDLENLHFYVRAKGERVVLDTPWADLLPGEDNTKPRFTTSLESGLIWDQRNNRLFPTEGYLLRGSIEVASPLLGSSFLPGAERELQKTLLRAGLKDMAGAFDSGAVANDFQRFTLNGRFYFAFDRVLPIRGIVAKANFELGYLRTQTDLPFESYYLGGIDSMRGYQLRSISPVALVETADGRSLGLQIGGNKQVNTSFELEFPLLEELGIRGVLFFDAGNVFGRGENLFYLGAKPGTGEGFDPVRDLPFGLYSSVGFGVRWFSPIGPLRFEWGLPLTRRAPGTLGVARGDDPLLFQFSIGNSF